MEQIKKYNYKDPLHQKGDPFGVTEAKVAHVNAVIDEVNLAKSDVVALDERVYTLENAPAPEAATEYYINGGILHFSDGTFAVTVDSHNTIVGTFFNGSYNVYGESADVFGFFGDTNGNFVFIFQNTQGILADFDDGNGSQSSNITAAIPSSIIINAESNLVDAYATASKVFIIATVKPYVQSQDLDFIADIRTHAYDKVNNITVIADIPTPLSTRRIFNFQLKFKKFKVEPA
jgi:hypothetical protein